MRKIQFIIILFYSIFFCSCLNAPKDYYYQFMLIEKWGNETREKTQRKITDVVLHPEQTNPLTVVFFPEEKDKEFRIVSITKPDLSRIEKLELDSKSKVPIAITEKLLSLTLNDAEIDVVETRLINGRLEGKDNLVRVNFVPKSLSYDSIYKQFLKVCAIVEAIQTQKGTVDKVNAIVEEENQPYIMLESSIDNYKGYINEEISFEEWVKNLEVKKF